MKILVILHLHHNGVCLRLRLGTVPRPTPYFGHREHMIDSILT